ncbi:MAG: hypothetical protein AB1757_17885 [Acidobacteriota bacterium]
MAKLIALVKHFGIGGLVFWLPSILLHLARGNNFSGMDVLLLTAILPVTTLLSYVVILKFWKSLEFPFEIRAIFLLLGIWILGPLYMMVEASFLGGGFTSSEGLRVVFLGTLLFPIFTPILATHKGTLGAIVITTLVHLALISLSKLTSFLGKSRNSM